jgi:uncharacterized repeat protein (TIGR01451 family)
MRSLTSKLAYQFISKPGPWALVALLVVIFLGAAEHYPKTAQAQSPHLGANAVAWRTLQPARHVPTSYQGRPETVAKLQSGAAPLAMASADFDRDGIADLVIGYASSNGGILALHRGNLDAFAPQSHASWQAIARNQFPAPFLPQASVIDVPEAPHFVLTGDFNGDGDIDILTGARGSQHIYLFVGNGNGTFSDPQMITLPGALTALAAGQVGVRDGKTDVVAGVRTTQSAAVLVYKGSANGLAGTPVSYSVPQPATQLEIGDLHGDGFSDVAVLAGGEVLIVHPTAQPGEDTSALIERVPAGSARSIAVGTFVWNRRGRMQLAVLASGGIVQVLAPEELDTRPFTKEEMRMRRIPSLRAKLPAEVTPQWAGESHSWNVVKSASVSGPMSAKVRLMAAGLSHTSPLDLMVVDPSDSRLHILPANTTSDGSDDAGEQTVEMGDAAVAVLPVRVNVDGRRGLLMMGSRSPQPMAMPLAPSHTYYVNELDDPAPTGTTCTNTSTTDQSSHCSLREAVIDSNATTTANTIMLPAGTITLTITGQGEGAAATGDVDVTESVTIVGSVDGGGNPTSIIQGCGGTSGISCTGNATPWNDKFISVNKEGTSNATVGISNVIFRNGKNTNSGATESGFDALGGAVAFYGCAVAGGGCSTDGFITFLAASSLSIANVQFLNNSIGDNTETGCSGSNNADCGGGLLSQFGDTTITGSTFTGNTATHGRGGALVLEGAVEQMTVSNSTFHSNTSGIEGGAIDVNFQNGFATNANPNVSIHSSTISNNSSGTSTAADGGGLYFEMQNGSSGPGTTATALIDGKTVISGNSAQRGGGIAFLGTSGPTPNSTSLTISKVTITGNQATGVSSNGGGGLYVPAAGSLTLQFSRIVGNIAPSGKPTGLSIEPAGASVGASSNWWGCNSGPSASPCDTAAIIGGSGATLTDTPYIVLTLADSPATLQPQPPGTQTSALTADFLHESTGTIALVNIDVLLGLPISFGATHGTISGAQTTIQSSGMATANVSPDTSCGTPLIASATVDSGTATQNITVVCPDLTITKSNNVSGSVPLATPTWTWTIVGSNSSAATAPAQFSNGQTIVSDTLPSSSVSYSILSTTTSFPTGSASCTLTSNVLNCAATSLVIMNPSGSLTVQVGATATAAGSYTNPTGGSCAIDPNNNIIESNESNNACAPNTVTVVAPPTIHKAFGASNIPVGGTTSLTFTLTNPSANTVALTGVAFNDTLTGGLQVASTPSVSNTCGGTLNGATSGGTSLTYSGGTIGINGSCTISLNVTGTLGGIVSNTTIAISSTNGGTGATSNTATLTVANPPTILKSFSPTSIPLNGVSTLSLMLSNPNATVNLTGVNFSDNMPSGMQVANPAGIGSNCSGTWNASPGDTSLNFGGGILSGGSSCTLTVNVTATSAGAKNNATNPPQSNEGGTGVASNTATLTVIAPPGISKAFELLSTIAASPTGATESGSTVTITTTAPHGFGTGQSVTVAGVGVAGYNGTFTITNATTTTFTYTDTNTGLASSGGGTATVPITTMLANGTATLAFTLTNPNSSTALSGVSFTDPLPSGLQVATTPNASAPCGTFAPNAGATTLSFSAGTLAGSATCTISVSITGTTAGVKNNTTGAVTSTEGGTGGTASATVTVLSPPSIGKVFGAANISPGGNTTLTFTITNPNGSTQLLGVAFTDPLPSGLAVASTTGASTTCGGTFAPNSGDTTLNFSGGTIAAAGTCTVSVNITATTPGVKNNTTGAVSSTNAGTGNTASASISVASPPSITKVFGASSIPVNGSTSLTFTITNPNASLAFTGVAFTDSLPAGLVVATPSALSNTCNGIATTGSGFVSLSAGTLASSAACTLSVNVTGVTAGVKNNAVQVTSTEGGTGNTSNASVTVVAPPAISKLFGAPSIPLNGATSLTFTIQNNNSSTALTGVAFTDTLPSGLVVSTPNGLTGSCAGTVTATAGTGVISLSAGSVTASNSCNFSVNVAGTTAGIKNNTTGNVTSTEGGTGTTASASLTVVAPPSIAKSFGAANIAVNGTTSLTFTITNPNASVGLTGVGVTDTLPAGLTVPTTGAQPACGGGVLTTLAPGTITLTGGSIATSTNCQFSVTVTGATSGVKNNLTGNVTSTNGGTGNTASASITVASPPTISKMFGASSIPVNGSTSLTFTIMNPNTGIGLTGVGFTDTLPAGILVATSNGLTSTCNGTTTATGGSGSVSLSAGTLAASGSCTLTVNVTGTTAGVKNNSVTVTSTEGGTGNTATASITVVAPPAISKLFGAASIPLGGTTSLSFTIQNPNTTTTLTGIGFSDSLPSGLIVGSPNGLTGSCGGGTITATAGAGVISLSGASLAANSSCTFSVNVTGTTAGAKNNTTGNVTSTQGGTGNTGSASLAVVAPPTINKAFGASSVLLGGTTSLTFTLTNPAANSVSETGVAFTDTLPAGLVVATPNALTDSCGGTAAATAGGSSISLTGGSIATGSSCMLVVNVTATSYGTKNNTTSAVSSTNGGTGTTSNTATISVSQPPAITSANSATFTIGVAGSFTVTTTGFPTPSIKESGPLPNGLTFVDNGNGTGTLHGTPMVFIGGDFGITFTAQNGVGSPATQPFTIILQQAPAFTSANNAVFAYGVPNSFTVTTVGFPAPTIHESGTLPPWLTFVDNGNGTATLSGTPSYVSGAFALVLTATNVVTTATQNFTLNVSGLNVSPSTLDFGSVYLNSKHTQTVTATNVGSANVTISGVGITLGTANAAAYTFVNHCTAALKPGKSCTITVTFLGDAVGTLTATLNVTDNTVGSPQQVRLTGTVIDPVAQFNPTKLAFGTQSVGSSTTLPVQLTNTGQTPLNISNIAVAGANSGEFTEVNNCPAILSSTMSCTISVTFAPTVKGARTGTLTVTDNVSAGRSTVALSGTGH